MKNHTNKLLLAFVMMAMNVHGAHNVNRYIDGGYALYDGEAILQNVSHNHKLDKRLNQSFVEYILEPYEKNKDASKLTELVKSQEIILFSSSKCSIESLKRLKHAFEKLQIIIRIIKILNFAVRIVWCL